MMRVLFQLVPDTQATDLAQTRDELRARQIESAVSHQPQPDLSDVAVVHFFGCEPVSLALRCAFHAMAKHKPFVITPSFASDAYKRAPAREMELQTRSLERAAQQFILQSAARIFTMSVNESYALAETFDVSPDRMLPASTEMYAKTYVELARLPGGQAQLNELALAALEDLTIASGLLTYSADVYYYQELTPKLEREAQRAGELQMELLAPKRKWIWERR